MSELSPGQNRVVEGERLHITLDVGGADVSAVLCDASGKARGDEDFVFYNQPRARGVSLADDGLTVTFGAVEQEIRTLVLLASLDGSGPVTFAHATREVRATITVDGASFATFTPGPLGDERALALVEVYRRGQEWKVRAVGQGWSDGLAGAARTYGIDVADDSAREASADVVAPPPAPPTFETPPLTPTPAVAASPRPASQQPASQQPLGVPAEAARPDAGDVVRLDKPGQARSVSLSKSAPERFHVNLNWRSSRRFGKTDLDLGCFVQTTDGRTTVLQALGGSFGSATAWPWILIDKDDRSGGAADGENLTIHRPDEIERVVIFALIYEGVSDFVSADAVATITQAEAGHTILPLSSPRRGKRFCAVALISKTGEGLTLTKEERYFPGHKQADAHYGFGFSWKRGSK